MTNHFLASFFAIHEAFWNDIWSQQLIALLELLEQDAVWKALSANANAFQNAITSQLIQHQRRVNFARLKPTNDTLWTITPTSVCQTKYYILWSFTSLCRQRYLHSPEYSQ